MKAFGDVVWYKWRKGVGVWIFGFDIYSQQSSLGRMISSELPVLPPCRRMDDIFDCLKLLNDSGAVVIGDLETDIVRDPKAGFGISSQILKELLPIFDRLKGDKLVKYRCLPDFELTLNCFLESGGADILSRLRRDASAGASSIADILTWYALSQPDTSQIYIDHGIEGTLLNDLMVDEKDNHDIGSLLLCDEKFSASHGYVILGMSGCGKSTLIRHLLGYMENIEQATKYTTRESRGYPEREVRIVSEDDFLALLGKNEFAASYEANGKRYGYLKTEIESSMTRKVDLFFDTTNIGFASALREAYPDYIRVILVQSEKEFAMGNLVKRYRDIPDDLTSVYDARMGTLERKNDQYKAFEKKSDFVLRRKHFALMQRELRDYILRQRFPDVLLR